MFPETNVWVFGLGKKLISLHVPTESEMPRDIVECVNNASSVNKYRSRSIF